jgi:hypothetical protein
LAVAPPETTREKNLPGRKNQTCRQRQLKDVSATRGLLLRKTLMRKRRSTKTINNLTAEMAAMGVIALRRSLSDWTQ